MSMDDDDEVALKGLAEAGASEGCCTSELHEQVGDEGEAEAARCHLE